jgi:hypothetical protein
MHPDVAIDDQRVTAMHEAGHALAYLSLGRRFRYVTLRSREAMVLGQVVVRPRLISLQDKAFIAMVGQMVDVEYLIRLGGDADELLADRYRSWQEAQDKDEDDEWSALLSGDLADAGSFGGLYMPLAHTFVKAVWAQIEVVGDALLASPRALTYDEVVTIAGNVDWRKVIETIADEVGRDLPAWYPASRVP